MVQIWNGLLPNCIFREWELYCNTKIYIAVRNLGGAKIVLQGSDCIARWVYCELKGWVLYCNTLQCIATGSAGWVGYELYHNTALYRETVG